MRAVISAVSVIEVQELAERVPGAGELSVAPDAVGICGTDIELLNGTMAYLTDGLASYPLVPGHEWTGLVDAVGPGVEGFSVGDRVVGEVSLGCGTCERCRAGMHNLCARRTETGLVGREGALSTQLLFPASIAHLIPSHVERLDAVLIEPLAVACRGLHRAGELPSRVGIVGGGTVGLMSAMAARALGVQDVIVVEPDDARRSFAASLGFEVAAEPGERAPLVVEAAGAPAAIAGAVTMCEVGGTIVVLGLTGAPSVELDLDDAVIRDITIIGSLSSPGVWPEAIDLVASGRVTPSSVVSHEVALGDVRAGFDLVRERAPGTRKVVVRPTKENR